MSKKFYAVRIGRQPGIYEDWEQAKAEVDGYPNASYKSFKNLADAQTFMGQTTHTPENKEEKNSTIEPTSTDTVIAYVDGSFDKSSQRYSFGAVLIQDDLVLQKLSRVGDNPKYQGSWQIAGEVFGALHAIQWAIEHQFKKIIVHYDYLGIEKWALGEWRTNKNVSIDYVQSFKKLASQIEVEFVKVKAHSGVQYNEMADQIAKDALKENLEK